MKCCCIISIIIDVAIGLKSIGFVGGNAAAGGGGASGGAILL